MRGKRQRLYLEFIECSDEEFPKERKASESVWSFTVPYASHLTDSEFLFPIWEDLASLRWHRGSQFARAWIGTKRCLQGWFRDEQAAHGFFEQLQFLTFSPIRNISFTYGNQNMQPKERLTRVHRAYFWDALNEQCFLIQPPEVAARKEQKRAAKAQQILQQGEKRIANVNRASSDILIARSRERIPVVEQDQHRQTPVRLQQNIDF